MSDAKSPDSGVLRLPVLVRRTTVTSPRCRRTRAPAPRPDSAAARARNSWLLSIRYPCFSGEPPPDRHRFPRPRAGSTPSPAGATRSDRSSAPQEAPRTGNPCGTGPRSSTPRSPIPVQGRDQDAADHDEERDRLFFPRETSRRTSTASADRPSVRAMSGVCWGRCLREVPDALPEAAVRAAHAEQLGQTACWPARGATPLLKPTSTVSEMKLTMTPAPTRPRRQRQRPRRASAVHAARPANRCRISPRQLRRATSRVRARSPTSP